jgi:hypothetical protein
MSELFTPESVQMMKRFEENFRYYARNHAELREKYRGRYIAIDQGKVIAENSDHSQLLDHLSRQYGDTRPIFIQYISEKEYMMTV